MILVNNIKTLCNQEKIFIPTLENILKLGNGAIYKWDISSPTLDNIIKVSKYFDVSIDWIIGKTNKREKFPTINNIDYKLALKDNLKNLCKNKNISISELEKLLSFGNGSIHKWSVNSPRVNNILKVAEYFQVSIDDLIGKKAITENLSNKPLTYSPEITHLIKVAEKLPAKELALLTELIELRTKEIK